MLKEIEKECRYQVNDMIIEKIEKIATVIEGNQEQIDVTLGYVGFESLYKYGYVCRTRKKGEKVWMEIKNKTEEGHFIETKVPIDNFNDGIKLFEAIGMKPYMFMKRKREILEYKGLKIFIDDVDILGKFVEIEFQDIDNKEVITYFLNMVGINSEKQPLYGDIIAKRLNEDSAFKEQYTKRLEDFLIK